MMDGWVSSDLHSVFRVCKGEKKQKMKHLLLRYDLHNIQSSCELLKVQIQAEFKCGFWHLSNDSDCLH